MTILPYKGSPFNLELRSGIVRRSHLAGLPFRTHAAGSAGVVLPASTRYQDRRPDGEGYNNGDMVLNAGEESLINVVRTLPPEEARKVLDWARQLGDLGRTRAVEWSDSWSEEDLADATAASLRRFDEQEREGR